MLMIQLCLWNMTWRKLKNVKLLLWVFEQVSGLEINLYKTEFCCSGDAQDHIDQYTTLSGSKLGDFLIWHLVFLSILGK